MFTSTLFHSIRVQKSRNLRPDLQQNQDQEQEMID